MSVKLASSLWNQHIFFGTDLGDRSSNLEITQKLRSAFFFFFTVTSKSLNTAILIPEDSLDLLMSYSRSKIRYKERMCTIIKTHVKP